MKKVFLLVFLLFTLVCNAELWSEENTLKSGAAQKIKGLAQQIQASFKVPAESGRKARLAVIELENIGSLAKEKNVGRSVSELLTTFLVESQKVQVVERSQLNQVLAEHKLNLSGVVDIDTAAKVGKVLAVDVVLCGSVSEVGSFFDINMRAIDVESASILKAAIIEVAREDFLPPPTGSSQKSIETRIQDGLDALSEAIQNYIGVNTRYKVAYPSKLEDLIPDYLPRLPDPVQGKWVYDPTNGEVRNSARSDILPRVVHPKVEKPLERLKGAQVMAARHNIETYIQMYFSDKGKYPRKLKDLIPDYIQSIPDPLDGEWIYDTKTGQVRHSKYEK